MAYRMDELVVLDRKEAELVLNWYLAWQPKLKDLIDKDLATAQKMVDIQKKLQTFIYDEEE